MPVNILYKEQTSMLMSDETTMSSCFAVIHNNSEATIAVFGLTSLQLEGRKDIVLNQR